MQEFTFTSFPDERKCIILGSECDLWFTGRLEPGLYTVSLRATSRKSEEDRDGPRDEEWELAMASCCASVTHIV